MKSIVAILWGACLVASCINGDKDGYSTICYIGGTALALLYWLASEYKNYKQ